MVDFEAPNKIMKNTNKIMALVLLLVLTLQPVMAYEVRSAMPALNLWDLFVEYTFGNFWMAVIGIGLGLGLILIMGGISFITMILFLSSYMLAMVLGYGYPLLSVVIVSGAFLFFIFQLWKSFDGS